jgi:hypothetical protein
MRIVLVSTTCLCLALAGCNKTSTDNGNNRPAEAVVTSDPRIAEKIAPPAPPAAVTAPAFSANMPTNDGAQGNSDAVATTPLTVSLPKIAYDYKYNFLLPADQVAAAQQAHIAACDKLGLARCQLVSSESGNSNATSLKLRVASDVARRFSADLVTSVAKAGGRAVDQSISAEDVSKEISDTNARIHQRELLIQRLTQILQTRAGKVSELVEAERSVAAAQEELDQAKAWLIELQGRVAMSDVEISYGAIVPGASPAGPPGQGPLSETMAQSWWFFTAMLYAILRLLIILAPWAILGSGIFFAVRAMRRRSVNPAEEGADSTPAEDIAPVA